MGFLHLASFSSFSSSSPFIWFLGPPDLVGVFLTDEFSAIPNLFSVLILDPPVAVALLALLALFLVSLAPAEPLGMLLDMPPGIPLDIPARDLGSV